MVSPRLWLERLSLACLLGVACKPSDDAAPAPEPAPSSEADAALLTPATVGGKLYASESASVAWARTLPGDMVSPPLVALGPGGVLAATVAIERRPEGPVRFLTDYWLLRFDADTGTLLWMRSIEPTAQLAVDTHGNIVLAWHSSVQKLDAAGNVLWSRSRPAEHEPVSVQLAIDSHDNLLLASVASDEPLDDLGNTRTSFVQLEQLDEDGNTRWSQRFGTGTSSVGGAYVAVDRDDAVVLLASRVEGPIDFGGGALSGQNVLAKYDASGNALFSKAIGEMGIISYRQSAPMVTDAAGNLFVWTQSGGELDIGLAPIFCPHDYVLKFDAAGTPLWGHCAFADEVAVLPNGDWVAAATLERTSTVGERQCSVAGEGRGKDGVLARYDSNGAWLSTSCASDPASQVFGNIAPDPGGMFFMTAAFATQLTLPGGSKVAAVDSKWTALIAKVDFPR
jgi:outer membrane protein assembly factor BamB